MALIRFAEGQQRSGSLGATVYSHNRYGQYVRARSVPVNPNTARQAAARSYLQNLAIRWNNALTQEQRDAWEVYSSNLIWRNALGDTTYLTGLAHFIRCNAPRLLVGLAILDAAPTTFTLAIPEQALVVTGSEASQQLAVAYDDSADWCSEDGAFQVIYMGLPKNPSIKFFGGPYRKCAVILGDSGTPPTSPEAPVESPDWPFAAGNRIWCRSRIGRADGRLSEFAEENFLAGA